MDDRELAQGVNFLTRYLKPNLEEETADGPSFRQVHETLAEAGLEEVAISELADLGWQAMYADPSIKDY